jgi:hypothetical protein
MDGILKPFQRRLQVLDACLKRRDPALPTHLLTRLYRLTSAGKPPPSFIQRSASRCAPATCVGAPPAITCSVVLGASSDAHRAPQRQHVSSWRAIGA